MAVSGAGAVTTGSAAARSPVVAATGAGGDRAAVGRVTGGHAMGRGLSVVDARPVPDAGGQRFGPLPVCCSPVCCGPVRLRPVCRLAICWRCALPAISLAGRIASGGVAGCGCFAEVCSADPLVDGAAERLGEAAPERGSEGSCRTGVIGAAGS